MKACYYIGDTLVIAASKADCSTYVPKYSTLDSFQNEFQKSQVAPVTPLLTYLELILYSSTLTIALPEEKFFKVFSATLTSCQAKRLK